MLSVLPPIFILLGLLDVGKRETMIKYMGDNSGIIGVLLAFFLGSAAAGRIRSFFQLPVYCLKKGSKLSNVFIMLGAWSTTKNTPYTLWASLGRTEVHAYKTRYGHSRRKLLSHI